MPREGEMMADEVVRAMNDAARQAANSWLGKLQTTDKGKPKSNLFNAIQALRHCPDLAGTIATNDFVLATQILKPLPWDDKIGRSWTNTDDLRLTEWLQDNEIGVGLEIAQQAVEAVAADGAFHPVRDWLDTLKWDGTKRVDGWLSYYLGCEDSDYARAIGRRWLISAVARIYKPGCKADHVIIFEGKQGIGKSTALHTLVGPEWYTDELSDFGSKDAAMQCRGKWVIELSELDHLNRGEVSRIKAFITRRADRFRPPYGKRVAEVARECVFAGTVNEAEYLKDDTGNRRFWPIACVSVDLDAIRDDREQIWAEAVALFRKGEVWWLDDDDLMAAARQEQAARSVEDPWTDAIIDYLTGKTEVVVSKILSDALEKRKSDWNRADEMRVAKILRNLGWERGRGENCGTSERPRVWKRKPKVTL